MEKGVHNLMGLVMDKDDYKQRCSAKFPTPTNPAVYNETIPNNAINVVWAKAEAVHMVKITDYLIFSKAKRETREFILAVVDNIWVC